MDWAAFVMSSVVGVVLYVIERLQRGSILRACISDPRRDVEVEKQLYAIMSSLGIDGMAFVAESNSERCGWIMHEGVFICGIKTRNPKDIVKLSSRVIWTYSVARLGWVSSFATVAVPVMIGGLVVAILEPDDVVAFSAYYVASVLAAISAISTVVTVIASRTFNELSKKLAEEVKRVVRQV